MAFMPLEEKSSTTTTAKASGDPDFWGRGESEVAMKKLCVGLLLALGLLFAQTASAEPCGLCQAYYPCSWSCEHCVAGFGGPGLWTFDGYCWGEVVEGTCGDIGQCGWHSLTSNSNHEPSVDQGVKASRVADSAVLGKTLVGWRPPALLLASSGGCRREVTRN